MLGATDRRHGTPRQDFQGDAKRPPRRVKAPSQDLSCREPVQAGRRQDKGEERHIAEPWPPTLPWDNQAKVWYVSETNFCGLVAEACTAPALLAKLERLASELFELDLHLLED